MDLIKPSCEHQKVYVVGPLPGGCNKSGQTHGDPTAAGCISSPLLLNWQFATHRFKEGATVQLFGCRTAMGDNSFVEELASHINRPVTGSQSGNSFSGVKDGKPGQGLPGNGSKVPANYKKPVYLVPEGKGWKTYGK